MQRLKPRPRRRRRQQAHRREPRPSARGRAGCELHWLLASADTGGRGPTYAGVVGHVAAHVDGGVVFDRVDERAFDEVRAVFGVAALVQCDGAWFGRGGSGGGGAGVGWVVGVGGDDVAGSAGWFRGWNRRRGAGTGSGLGAREGVVGRDVGSDRDDSRWDEPVFFVGVGVFIAIFVLNTTLSPFRTVSDECVRD